MNCLHCGHCCRSLNPFGDDVCRYLYQQNTFYFCSIYNHRPAQCREHRYPFKHCPIGIDILKVDAGWEVWQRIEQGYLLLKEKNL